MAPTGERGRGKGNAAPAAPENRKVTRRSRGTRGARGRFAKGTSGNPGGRPKLLAELKEKIQARGDELVDKLFAIAFEQPKARKVGRRVVLDGASPKERVMAIEKLLAYGYGKPVQAVELSGPGGGPVRTSAIDNLTSGERRKRIRELLTLAAAESAEAPAAAAPADPASEDADPPTDP